MVGTKAAVADSRKTGNSAASGDKKHDGSSGNYAKFALMMLISFLVMYAVMYLNTYAFDHIFFSMTRFYMTFLMISPMALIMLAFMRGMYKNKLVNMSIVAASVVVFTLALVFVRAQTFIGDSAWMSAMIPHHSIAILTSERAKIEDPEVRKLADNIIETQRKEIDEMKRLLEKVK
ncbi:MAG: DUF305 domain-containing protein [Pyrinomonadaceae bacterium]|nr:DUF305 domain-containing protein [Pyrinomonadaceae bacterium]